MVQRPGYLARRSRRAEQASPVGTHHTHPQSGERLCVGRLALVEDVVHGAVGYLQATEIGYVLPRVPLFSLGTEERVMHSAGPDLVILQCHIAIVNLDHPPRACNAQHRA